MIRTSKSYHQFSLFPIVVMHHVVDCLFSLWNFSYLTIDSKVQVKCMSLLYTKSQKKIPPNWCWKKSYRSSYLININCWVVKKTWRSLLDYGRPVYFSLSLGLTHSFMCLKKTLKRVWCFRFLPVKYAKAKMQNVVKVNIKKICLKSYKTK